MGIISAIKSVVSRKNKKSSSSNLANIKVKVPANRKIYTKKNTIVTNTPAVNTASTSVTVATRTKTSVTPNIKAERVVKSTENITKKVAKTPIKNTIKPTVTPPLNKAIKASKSPSKPLSREDLSNKISKVLWGYKNDKNIEKYVEKLQKYYHEPELLNQDLTLLTSLTKPMDAEGLLDLQIEYWKLFIHSTHQKTAYTKISLLQCQKAKQQYQDDKDLEVYMAALEGILLVAPKDSLGITWTFELPNLYAKAKRFDEAIEYCQKYLNHPTFKYRAQKDIRKFENRRTKYEVRQANKVQ